MYLIFKNPKFVNNQLWIFSHERAPFPIEIPDMCDCILIFVCYVCPLLKTLMRTFKPFTFTLSSVKSKQYLKRTKRISSFVRWEGWSGPCGTSWFAGRKGYQRTPRQEGNVKLKSFTLSIHGVTTFLSICNDFNGRFAVLFLRANVAFALWHYVVTSRTL